MVFTKEWKRSFYCGELRPEHEGEEVTINGWVRRVRDLGGILFWEVWDHTGLVQVVFDPALGEVFDRAKGVREESVVSLKGVVRRRPEGTENPKLATGWVEIAAKELALLSPSKTPPFSPETASSVDEAIRLRYRYLDLRRDEMQRNLRVRSRAYRIVRDHFYSHGFVEVETPILTKSTPEGARDYLVPSRLHPGKFYALPQSPQLFKQLLMVSGLDRYFQIARCFRDEDLRADRQPEFTQVDVEMAFMTEEDVFSLVEELLQRLFGEIVGVEVERPFPRIGYDEAMLRYGTDRPDLRIPLVIEDLTEAFRGSGISLFEDLMARGARVRGIRVPAGKASSLSRRRVEELQEMAKGLGLGGLAPFHLRGGELSGPLARQMSEGSRSALLGLSGMSEGDLLLVACAEPEVLCEALGALRLHLGEGLGMVEEGYRFCWVVDFPLFEWSEEEGRLVSVHHPFTSPRPQDLHLLDSEPLRVKARAYDVVLNGVEIGGGSVRIHDPAVQSKVFQILGIDEDRARERFGFLLEAFSYGVPPHGGIALGFDRIVAMMVGSRSIRDVIAFPKNQRALCPLTGAPSDVEERQLREVHIRVSDEG